MSKEYLIENSSTIQSNRCSQWEKILYINKMPLEHVVIDIDCLIKN
jgi:hypothetical protein